MKLSSLEECLSLLQNLSIPYIMHRHEPVFNMVEMQQKVPLEKAPLIKNLFYYDKKNFFYLVLAKSDTQVGKQFWKSLGLSPGNIRMAREDHLNEILKVQKGNVNPFAVANDSEKKISKIVMDKMLESSEYLAFHPMDNSATIEIKNADFLTYLTHFERKVDVCSLEDTAV